nr:MAG: hypothetical protein H4Bulk473037_000003 [Mitovirus sp.]
MDWATTGLWKPKFRIRLDTLKVEVRTYVKA